MLSQKLCYKQLAVYPSKNLPSFPIYLRCYMSRTQCYMVSVFAFKVYSWHEVHCFSDVSIFTTSGRPFPLKGRYMANVFVHFEPIGHVGEEIAVEPDLPQYVIRGEFLCLDS